MNVRKKGHDYERKIANELTDLIDKKVHTSRAINLMDDAEGIDMRLKIGENEFGIQCKAVEKLGNHHKIIKEINHPNPVLFHKRNRQGEVVTIPKELFYKLCAG